MLNDEGVGSGYFTPEDATVFVASGTTGPGSITETSQISTMECQVWQVTAKLVGFKAEDDGDFHIVIADLRQPEITMVVEMPDSVCTSVCDSPHCAEMDRARKAFAEAFGYPSKRFQRPSNTELVTVTGVGFFDFKHRQTAWLHWLQMVLNSIP